VDVTDHRVGFKALHVVGEPFWDQQAFALVRRQIDAEPLAECWRLGPQVHRYVEDPAGDAGDDLRLSAGLPLHMEALDRAEVSGAGQIDVDNF
jgi:hypothetical protein